MMRRGRYLLFYDSTAPGTSEPLKGQQNCPLALKRGEPIRWRAPAPDKPASEKGRQCARIVSE